MHRNIKIEVLLFALFDVRVDNLLDSFACFVQVRNEKMW